MARIGSLRTRLALEEDLGTQDAYGQQIVAWTHVRDMWTSVEALGSRELLSSDSRFAEVDVRVRCRYSPDIVPEMRLTRGSVVYTIQTVIDRRGERRELELLCVTGVRD